MKQHTLKSKLILKGIGLHSGCETSLTFNPAPINSGIVFKRQDTGEIFPALYSNVVDTRNCTCLGNGKNVISTIEHVMATLYICGIDNALIVVNNPELPIMDVSR